MRFFLVPLFIWLLSINCDGQNEARKNILSFNWGAGYIARQDLIFSPFIHTDFSLLNLVMEYTHDANLFHKVSLGYANFNPMIADSYEFTIYGEYEEAYPHSFNLIDLSYQVGKKLEETNRSSFTIGGLFSAKVQAMNYVYGRISSFGYYSTFGLGLVGIENLNLHPDGKLLLTLQLPLVAWFARSPYLVNDDEFIENISSHSSLESFMAFLGDGEMVTLNRLQSLDLMAEYAYRISEKWELGVSYSFEFIHAFRSRNLISYRNSLNLLTQFNF